jgi:hypothetical protein
VDVHEPTDPQSAAPRAPQRQGAVLAAGPHERAAAHSTIP